MAVGYTAGNLFLNISSATQSAEQGVQRVINSLSRLSKAIKTISGIDTTHLQSQLTKTFTAISASIARIDVTKLQQLSTATAGLKNLSYLSKLNNLVGLDVTLSRIDFTKVSAGFAQLTASITPFLTQIQQAEKSLVALYGILQKVGASKVFATATGTSKAGGGFGRGGLGRLINFSSLYMAFFLARRIGQAISDIAQAGSDYVETLNLWEVAMRDNVDLATQFVDKMNEAYGVSRKTLMNAQAIFKNMIGSLGLISEEGAYAISEGITQMAIDYSSLYNVSLESAMTRFQSALAGQVRPIRSIAGYDITEITLYQLYQTLGGTKTMRQLTRTEKQLLSIYAIFNQMDRSGAVGDMKKTIDSYANQSRVMTEAWTELKTWIGTLLTYFIKQKGILVTINKYLIYYGEILKAVAIQLDAIQSFGGDPFAGTEESANNASKAVDELGGKLLDFDKFRALNTSEDENVDLDTTVLNALSSYTSILENATFEARRLANEMLIENGWFDENGVFNSKKLNEAKQSIEDIVTTIKLIGTLIVGLQIYRTVSNLSTSFAMLAENGKKAFSPKMLGITALVGALIYLYTANEDFRKSVNRLFTAVGSLLNHTMSALQPILDTGLELLDKVIAPILTGIINVVAWVVELVDKLGILDEILLIILSYKIGLAIARIIPNMFQISLFLTGFGTKIKALWATGLLRIQGFLRDLPLMLQTIGRKFTSFLGTTSGLITGLALLAVGVYSFINAWGDMGWGQRIITMVSAITAGVIGLVVALKALHLGVPAAIALGAMLAGGVLMIGSSLAKNSVTKFAEGGMPDKGTMFVAGEAGAEIVYNTPSGQSGVANISQIEQAMYGALVRYGRTQGANGQPIEVYLDGEKVYQNTTAHAKRRGNVWGKA